MTILEWLHTIEDVEVRERAVRNYENEMPEEVVEPESLEDALFGAFVFMDTPEGSDYWHKIAHNI